MGQSSTKPVETELIDHSLCVFVEQAILYLDNDMTKIDPYVRLRVGHSICQTPSALNGGSNPKWNEVIEIEYVPTMSDIHLEILGKSTFEGDKLLAWTTIAIPKDLKTGGTRKEWHRLNGILGKGRAGIINLLLDLKIGKPTIRNENSDTASNVQKQISNEQTVLVKGLISETIQDQLNAKTTPVYDSRQPTQAVKASTSGTTQHPLNAKNTSVNKTPQTVNRPVYETTRPLPTEKISVNENIRPIHATTSSVNTTTTLQAAKQSENKTNRPLQGVNLSVNTTKPIQASTSSTGFQKLDEITTVTISLNDLQQVMFAKKPSKQTSESGVQPLDFNKPQKSNKPRKRNKNLNQLTDSSTKTESVEVNIKPTGQNLLYSPLTRVNCQFCLQVFTDLSCLHDHVRNNCTIINNKTFQNLDRVLFSYLIIILHKKNKLKCTACNYYTFNFEELMEHSSTKEHEERVEIETKNKTARKCLTKFLYCSSCDMNVPDNITQYKQHLATFKHQANTSSTCKHVSLNKEFVKEMNILFSMDSYDFLHCQECNTDVYFLELGAHVVSAKHSDSFNLHCAPCLEVVKNVNNKMFLKHKHSASHRLNVNIIHCTFCGHISRNYKELAAHQVHSCTFKS